MALRISGKNIDIGAALRGHVESRVAAATSKYFDGSVSGHVTLEPEGSGYRTDCALHLSSGIDLQAEGRAQDPYASFDQAAERIEKRLRRYKRRLKEHQNGHGANGAEMAEQVIASPDEHAAEAEDYHPVVIAEGASRLRSLSVAAAVLDFDMSGAPVMVFTNSAHGRVNIVYRRTDGHIGWIDPPAQAKR